MTSQPSALRPFGPSGALVTRLTLGTSWSPDRVGALDTDLAVAVERALTADRDACVRIGTRYCWSHCTDQFVGNLVEAGLPTQGMAATA